MQRITSLDDLDDAFSASSEKPVMLFKHSTRCSLSAHAYAVYKPFADNAATVNCTYLDLLQYREVSNAIAEKTGIQHKSPQAILLVNGAPVWNASHFDITLASLKSAVSDATRVQ